MANSEQEEKSVKHWALQSGNGTDVWREDLFKGRVLVISGGGTGIGLGICTAFGKLGCSIALCGRRKNVLDDAVAELQAKGIKAAAFVCDVRDPDSCVRFANGAMNTFGRIDFLVNNAAGNFIALMEDLSPNGFKSVIDIDLHGSFNMAKAVLPHLKSCGGGVIVNISATLYYSCTPFQMHASAAKSAVDVMTNNIGIEWAEHGIRAVSIAPGPISGTTGGPTGRVFGKLFSQFGGRTPSKKGSLRLGEVGDIANAAVFVCSPAASYITSTTIVVDGGEWHKAAVFYHYGKDLVRQVSKQEKATHKGGVSKL